MVKVRTTDGLLLELKFSSVLSTAVPVSGLILVLQRSVGSSPAFESSFPCFIDS